MSEEETVKKLNSFIDKTLEELKIAIVRAESAEKNIELFRQAGQEEITKAYNLGYQKGLKDAQNSSESGGQNKENETKLVLTNN